MRRTIKAPITTRANLRQAYILLVLGGLSLVAAWVLRLNPLTYPIGILLLGLGMLVAALVNPTHLVIASCLTTALGVAVLLAFRQVIPGNQILPAYILAIGVGLFVIALAARRSYINRGALSPAILVIVVGVIEYLLAKGLTPSWFIPFALSLWLPGIGLLILGLGYLLSSFRR